jgi:hypothetical protein
MSFEKITEFVDKSGKLILKTIGTLVAIGLAIFAGLDQLAGDEPIEEANYEVLETDTTEIDSVNYEENQRYQDR